MIKQIINDLVDDPRYEKDEPEEDIQSKFREEFSVLIEEVIVNLERLRLDLTNHESGDVLKSKLEETSDKIKKFMEG